MLPADYVTTEDGTGIVHIAPAFGEEDKVSPTQYGIAPVVPVGPDGRFTFPVTEYEGLHVFDANPQIIEHLKNATATTPPATPTMGGHARGPCCCDARPTTTRTRTAGAAASP